MNNVLILGKNPLFVHTKKHKSVIRVTEIETLLTSVGTINEISWIACDADIFEEIHVRFDVDKFTVKTDFDVIQDIVEACCFLERIVIIVPEDATYIDIIETWLNSLNIPFSIEKTQPITYNPQKPLVVSNVSWDPKETLRILQMLINNNITHINFAPSMYSNLDRHMLHDLRQTIEMEGLKVMSINSIFYDIREVNVFTAFPKFVDHFKKMIEYAHLLGAKYVIYGGAHSKTLQFRRIDTYDTYQKSHTIFVTHMKEIAKYAALYNIIIMIKPNSIKKTNYLTNAELTNDIVNAIDASNVITGNMRTSICTEHADFNLLEANCDSDLEFIVYEILPRINSW